MNSFCQTHEREARVQQLEFELRRARSRGDDWMQNEDEYLRLNVEVKRLEEKLEEKQRDAQENLDELIRKNNEVLELRYELERSPAATARTSS